MTRAAIWPALLILLAAAVRPGRAQFTEGAAYGFGRAYNYSSYGLHRHYTEHSTIYLRVNGLAVDDAHGDVYMSFTSQDHTLDDFVALPDNGKERAFLQCTDVDGDVRWKRAPIYKKPIFPSVPRALEFTSGSPSSLSGPIAVVPGGGAVVTVVSVAATQFAYVKVARNGTVLGGMVEDGSLYDSRSAANMFYVPTWDVYLVGKFQGDYDPPEKGACLVRTIHAATMMPAACHTNQTVGESSKGADKSRVHGVTYDQAGHIYAAVYEFYGHPHTYSGSRRIVYTKHHISDLSVVFQRVDYDASPLYTKDIRYLNTTGEIVGVAAMTHSGNSRFLPATTATPAGAQTGIRLFMMSSSDFEYTRFMHIGTPQQDYVFSMTVDPEERYSFIVGATEGNMAPRKIGDTDLLMVQVRLSDMFIVRQWQGGSEKQDILQKVFVSPRYGVFVAGFVRDPPQHGGGQSYSSEYMPYLGRMHLDACPKGSYRTGFPACTSCTGGTYTPAPDSLMCTDCAAGYSTRGGSSSVCEACSEGTYSPAKNTPECLPCSAGTANDRTAQTTCVACKPGSSSSSAGEKVCTLCPFSKYQDRPGQKSCLSCPLGSSTDFLGASSELGCTCAEGEYGRPTDKGSPRACKDCPANTKCARGSQMPTPEKGWWISSSDPDQVFQCSPVEACPEGSVDTCGEGYEGEACSECADGYFRSKNQCSSCFLPTLPLWAGGMILMLVGAGFIVLVAAGMGLLPALSLFEKRKVRSRGKTSHVSGAMHLCSAFVRFCQLCMVSLTIPVEWPVSLTFLRTSVSLLSLDLETVFQAECLFGKTLINPTTILWSKVIAVLVIMGLLFGLFAGSLALRWNKTTQDPADRTLFNTLRGTMSLMSLLYLVMHGASVNVFTCFEKVSGSLYLVSDPTIKCYTTSGPWITMVPGSVICFVIFSLGTPIVFAVVTYCVHQRRHNPGPTDKLHFLWAHFTVETWWWTIPEMGHKFLLGMSLPLTSVSPYDALNFVVGVNLAYILLYIWKRPFDRPVDDNIEYMISLIMLSLSLAGMVFSAKEGNGSAIGSRIIEVIVTIFVVVTCCYILFAVILELSELLPARTKNSAFMAPCRLLRRWSKFVVDKRLIPMKINTTKRITASLQTKYQNLTADDVFHEVCKTLQGQLAEAGPVMVREMSTMTPGVGGFEDACMHLCGLYVKSNCALREVAPSDVPGEGLAVVQEDNPFTPRTGAEESSSPPQEVSSSQPEGSARGASSGNQDTPSVPRDKSAPATAPRLPGPRNVPPPQRTSGRPVPPPAPNRAVQRPKKG